MTYHRVHSPGLMPALLLLLVLSLRLQAAWGQSALIKAQIALKGQRSPVTVVLTRRHGNTLSARLPDKPQGTIRYQANEVKQIRISLPLDVLRESEAAARAGKPAIAARLMRPVLHPLLPYVDLPLGDTLDSVFRYADYLRQAQSWNEALPIYNALRANPDPDVRRKAIGWLAYSLVRARHFDKGLLLLESYTNDDPRVEGFVPASVAHARIEAENARLESSLDWASRAAALSRIDHELHAEAIFLSAEAYRRMADLSPTNRDTEDVVQDDNELQLAPRTPPMPPEAFRAAASSHYQHITNFFPRSPFVERATEQLQSLGAASPALLITPTGDTP